MNTFDLPLPATGPLAALFRERGIRSFGEACEWVRLLPYGRNSSKTDPAILFMENRGTCSTKHALLAKLADEHALTGIRLMMGIYRMNRRNTPGILDTLEKHGLEYIPEAHNYLRIDGTIVDCTGVSFEGKFAGDLLEELVICPEQVSDFKVSYHQAFLEKWRKANHPDLSFDELWRIREQCILQLSS